MRSTCPSVTGLAARAKRQVGSSLRMVQGRISNSRMTIAPSSRDYSYLSFFVEDVGASAKGRDERRNKAGQLIRLHGDLGGPDDRPPLLVLAPDPGGQILGR